MFRKTSCCLTFLLSALLLTSGSLRAGERETDSLRERISLHEGWALQSSCKAGAGGEVISNPNYHPEGWHSAIVPSTVLAALAADKTYPDPYFNMNLRSIPGTTYPIGENFANLPMPKDSPFACSWWYRTEFRLPVESKSRIQWLHFSGINYRANIWLNGKRIAAAADVAGAYRIYEFDFTGHALYGQENVLAVETFAPTEKDLGINWVDWNPAPPDKDMGLWGEVYLTETGPVALRHPQVVTHFPSQSLDCADLTIEAQVHNATQRPVSGFVVAEFDGLRFRQSFALQAREARTVRFATDRFPKLRIFHPRLWWPAQLGAPALHALAMRVEVGGETSDEQRTRFGIREVTFELDAKGHRLFRINHRRILIRGGGWAPDMLLRPSDERLEAQLQYVLSMNLNAVRLEGKLETDHFFDLADEYGILVLAGWCCCDHWEHWKKWTAEDLHIATESLRSQILRLRGHPSLLVWFNGSDNPPPGNVETAYLQVLKDTAWPNPALSSASEAPTPLTGRAGVKMTGPYDFVPPEYWLVDQARYGGAFGFNTETSPGPAIPLLSSLRKMIPADHLWPIDEFWFFHAGGGAFKNLNHYNRAMEAIYGKAGGLEEYITKSQAMAYDGERAMFEAYTRNRYVSTGVIQWMLNNAWPSLIWHVFDYLLQPAGGYFGAKKACEPLHIQYSYDDRSVAVVNISDKSYSGLTANAELYDINLEKKYSDTKKLDVAGDTTNRVFTIPAQPATQFSHTGFVKLALLNAAGESLSSNFYWISTKPAEFDWNKTDYRYTPVSSYPDLTELNRLARVRLEASAARGSWTEGQSVLVQLHNPAPHLAFQVRVGIREADKDSEILPVFWDDNYFELMPAETRTVTAKYPAPGIRGKHLELAVTGWNVEEMVIPIAAGGSEAGQRGR